MIFVDCELFDGEVFSTLTPFFEQNHNLRCLSVGGGCRSGSAPDRRCFLSQIALLAGALSRFSTLREVSFYICGDLRDDEDLGPLISAISALAGHSRMTKIELVGSKFGGRVMTALADLLTNPNSSLEELELRRCSLDDEGAIILGTALAGNSTLRNLNLFRTRGVTSRGWMAIFNQLLQSEQQSSLEKLDLSENVFDCDTAMMLGFALNGTHVKSLRLGKCKFTSEGWKYLCAGLAGPRCVLQHLNLYGCHDFDDGMMKYLANSLSSNCALSHLVLSSNFDQESHWVDSSNWEQMGIREHPGVTASGWRTFFAALLNPNSALESVDVGSSRVDNDALVLFASSLVHNSKLKELLIARDDTMMLTGWKTLSHVLCDKLNINATFNSNHTFQRLIPPGMMESHFNLPSDLRALLQLNRETTKAEAARRDFNVEPFVDMKSCLTLLLGWPGTIMEGRCSIYL